MGIFIIYSYDYKSGQGQDKRKHCVFHRIKIDRPDKQTHSSVLKEHTDQKQSRDALKGAQLQF